MDPGGGVEEGSSVCVIESRGCVYTYLKRPVKVLRRTTPRGGVPLAIRRRGRDSKSFGNKERERESAG